MADPTISIGLTVTAAGAQPTPPDQIRSNLLTLVASINPGYTVLPAGLIEDLSSTAVGGIALIDSAAVETVNSVTPFAANPYLLQELGNVYGIQPGSASNTSVYVQFSSDTPGVQIPKGYLVTDGTYQYQVQEGGVIQSDGLSTLIYCLATQTGAWAVPANTVTTMVSSIQPGITLAVTNPSAGTPSAGTQTQAQYASLVLQAGLVTGQGTPNFARTLLSNVAGVQPRLVSIVQINGGGWEVICGGGDPYAIANAIFLSGLDISTLVGSTIHVTGITNASPGVVTTDLNHGLTTGQNNVHIAGVVGMTGVNGGPYTVTVIDEKNFSFGENTTSSGAWTSGGVVTPNERNISVNLSNYPNVYTVPFVNPPPQQVTLQLGWNSISPNFVSDTGVAQLGTPALVNYINSIPTGAPINLLALNSAFLSAVLPLFNNNPELISTLNWTVSINGVETVPTSGTTLIYGDPESYFNTVSSSVAINQV